MIEHWLTRDDRAGHLLWIGTALLFGAYAAVFGLIEAFSSPYVIQDDARQHVFWMQRFEIPELFLGDPAADYFQSVAPVGYVSLYRWLAYLGIDPMTASRILPLPITLIYAVAAYAVGFAIARKPVAGFLVAWVAVQNVWLLPDVSSATPRAFLYPLFMAFLAFAMLRRPYWATLAVLGIGVFYPAYAILAGGIAVLISVDWRAGRLSRVGEPRKLQTAVFCFVASLSVLAVYALHSGGYGPVVSRSEAVTMPEFWTGGRSQFFDADSIRFWTCGDRSGLLPPEWCQLRDLYWGPFSATFLLIPIFLGVLILPFVYRERFTDALMVLPRVLLAGIGIYFAAHAVLFDLHLPGRYTQHSFRIVFDISLGLLLFLVVRGLSRRAAESARGGIATHSAAIAAFAAFLLFFPLVVGAYGFRGYVTGGTPALYEFLQRAPQNATVVSLEEELSNIPAFTGRSAVGAMEHSIPYHLGYYLPFRERVRALAVGQYTDDQAVLAGVIERLSPAYWLLSESSYEARHVRDSWWALQFPEIASRMDEKQSVLRDLSDDCEVLKDGSYRLIDATCLNELLK